MVERRGNRTSVSHEELFTSFYKCSMSEQGVRVTRWRIPEARPCAGPCLCLSTHAALSWRDYPSQKPEATEAQWPGQEEGLAPEPKSHSFHSEKFSLKCHQRDRTRYLQTKVKWGAWRCDPRIPVRLTDRPWRAVRPPGLPQRRPLLSRAAP